MPTHKPALRNRPRCARLLMKARRPKLPGRCRFTVRHAVVQSTQPCAVDGDHVAQLVREAAAGLVTVFNGCKQRAEEQHEPVGVLVRRLRLRHQVGRGRG